MGMRCIRMGYGFHWDAGKNPYMTRPDGRRIDLEAIDDVLCTKKALIQIIPDERYSIYRVIPAFIGEENNEPVGRQNAEEGIEHDTDFPATSSNAAKSMWEPTRFYAGDEYRRNKWKRRNKR